MYDDEFDALMEQIEEETGFTCYETQLGSQLTFFGTSDTLDAFKALASNKLPNGTIVYTMDDGGSQMYSRFKNAWYA